MEEQKEFVENSISVEEKGEISLPTEEAVEAEPCAKCGGKLFLKKLIFWENPQQSGLILGCGVLSYLLSAFGSYTLFGLVSNMMFFILLISFLYVNGLSLYAKFFSKSESVNPHVPYWSDRQITLNRECIINFLDKHLDYFNGLIENVREIYYCTNTIKTLKALGILFVVSKFANCFSIAETLITIFVFIFTVPMGYKMKKAEIDAVVCKAYHTVKGVFSQVLSKIPVAKKKDE
eukprot:GCRY01000662.1.p1 GENE.GCRY01000662.1~~GCRY01000662.1.p1  ORF type:complete len:234 (-),score=44.55 GCRY01000662.1:100-801(-)